jgi:2',3'-cyclic-nucleotide 2'-phosphodiesterase (5'-nucleotidase family)
MGGLSRRATIIQALPNDAPVFVVDAGDMVWKKATVSRDRLLQQQRKGELQHAALMLSGMDAMTPGEGDLALGVDWLKAQVQAHTLPMIATNLVCGGEKPFLASKVVERDGVRLGFIGLLEPDLVSGDCQASDPIQAAKTAVATLSGQVDLVIALAHQSAATDRDLADAVKGIDLIVNGHGKRSNPVPARMPGAALELGAGSRGKRVGVAEITLRPDAQGFYLVASAAQVGDRLQEAKKRAERNEKRVETAKSPKNRDRAQSRQSRLDERVMELEAELARIDEPPPADQHAIRNRIKALGDDIDDHPATLALVESAKVEIDALAARPNSGSAVIGTTYIGSTVCGSCHAVQHKQWSTTPHARAWATLEQTNRSHDLDCWSCHVTGAGLPGGPTHPTQVTGLENVGCESCHGPGAAHVAAAGKAPMTRTPPESTCVQCHDGVKDEGRFEAAVYFGKVAH